MSTESIQPRIGIALGGGAARGWAHIGVLRALAEHGIEPDIVCGTSIGAMVGGMYAAGKLAEFEDWVTNLNRREVLSLLDFTVFGGGPIAGQRLMDLYRKHLGDIAIEELPRQYAAVATDLNTGSEVWLQHGPLLTAIRASISLPGVFTPVFVRGRWLVDGGLVNPVPVSLCRALGADLVIGVDLNQGLVRAAYRQQDAQIQSAVVRDHSEKSDVSSGQKAEPEQVAAAKPPNINWVVNASLSIMQDRITRSRLAGDPPDLLLTPRVSHIAWSDFTNSRPAIEEGYNVVQRSIVALRGLLQPDQTR